MATLLAETPDWQLGRDGFPEASVAAGEPNRKQRIIAARDAIAAAFDQINRAD